MSDLLYLTERDKARMLKKELDALIRRFANEIDISYAAAVGVLHLKADELSAELRESE